MKDHYIDKSLPLFISFSGGLTSGFMTKYLFDKYPNIKKVVLFANTGKERCETLDFVNECDKKWGLNVVWLEYDPQKEHGKKNWFKVVDYETASRNGEPFERFIKKEGIPNVANAGCSSRMKERVMHNYIKHVLEWKVYQTAIGIRHDENHRIKWKAATKKNYKYPLAVEFPVSKSFVNNWWGSQDFKLSIESYQGNCDCCFKKSFRKLYAIANENPRAFEWWAEMEEKHGNGYTFFRKNTSTRQLLRDAKGFNSLFDTNLDIENKCSCS